MAKPTPTTPYLVTQQALNAIRQFVNAQGWPTSLSEAYDGNRLITKHLPELDPIDWVKTEAEVALLKAEDRVAYQARDQAWSAKTVELNLTPKQVVIIKRAFTYGIIELAKAKRLGPNPAFNEICDVFAIDPQGKV